MKKAHHVKVWPDYFEPLASGKKPFDVRVNDRDYKEGDTIVFHEWDDRRGKYTERQTAPLCITYVLHGGGAGSIAPLRGLAHNYVVIALAPLATSVAATPGE